MTPASLLAAAVGGIRPGCHHQWHVVVLRRVGDAESEGDAVEEARGGELDAARRVIVAGVEDQFVVAGLQGGGLQQGLAAAAVVVGCRALEQRAVVGADCVQLDRDAGAGAAVGSVEYVGGQFCHRFSIDSLCWYERRRIS